MILEQYVAITYKDKQGNTVLALPYTKVDNVDGAVSDAELAEILKSYVKTVNGQLPINGNVQINIPDIPADADYVIESGGTNDKWYEIWKSGKIVQGGKIVKDSSGPIITTFLKPFSELPRLLLTIESNSNDTTFPMQRLCYRNLSTTNFTTYRTDLINLNANWLAIQRG